MPLRALGATASLTGLDWAAWQWASNNGHDTVGLITGVLLVPAAVAFGGCLAITLLGVVTNAAERIVQRRRERADRSGQGPLGPTSPVGGVGSSPGTTPGGRIAA
jgi:hypothetical protein